MASILTLPTVAPVPAWKHRLASDDFIQPAWDDFHPDRTALPARLPPKQFRLAQLIDRLVDRLDLKDLVDSYSHRGSPAHRPDLLLKAVLFFTQSGYHSPADWFFQSRDSRLVSWLLRGLFPSRARWYEFRKRLSLFIDDLNRQLLSSIIALGLLLVDIGVVDGTFLAANSSRHVLFNQKRLQKRLAILEIAIEADLASSPSCQKPATLQAASPASPSDSPTPVPCAAATAVASKPTVDTAQSTRQEGNPSWLAKTVQGRTRQQKSCVKAMSQLNLRLEANRKRRKEDRKPDDQVRVSLGDSEAVLGLDKHKVYRPLYNEQLVSDLQTDFYLGYDVFATTNDTGTFEPMLARVEYFTGQKLNGMLGDAAYISGANLRHAEQKKVNLIGPYQENDYSSKKQAKQLAKKAFVWNKDKGVYVCPEGKELKLLKTQNRKKGDRVEKESTYGCALEVCSQCPRRQECLKSEKSGRTLRRGEYEEEVERHREKMSQATMLLLYGERKKVERRIADGKEHRDLRRLSMRGRQGGKTQVGLVMLAGNLVEMDKQLRKKEKAKAGKGKEAEGGKTAKKEDRGAEAGRTDQGKGSEAAAKTKTEREGNNREAGNRVCPAGWVTKDTGPLPPPVAAWETKSNSREAARQAASGEVEPPAPVRRYMPPSTLPDHLL